MQGLLNIRRAAVLAALAAALAVALTVTAGPAPAQRGGDCTPVQGNGRDAQGANPSSPNPLVGLRMFNDPAEKASVDYRRYRARGQTQKAGWIKKLADAPKFRWTGRFTSMKYIDQFIDKATCAGSVPLMVTLRHIGQQCNPRYQAGGVAEDNRTKAWFRQFADTVGNRRVVIAFEPDSVGTIDCLAKSRRKARIALLRYGVDQLASLPNATVYLEGTASDWVSVRYAASVLKQIGVAKVRGFMLNVTHYDWTANNIRFGNALSRRIGGKPFVVSTSYNGRGPVHFRRNKRRINVYCNPQFRGLGPAPTTNTGYSKVDAFLYINRPGISGAGGCNGGPRKVGTWWPSRALMFGKYATEWLRPPKGTRFGFKKRYSLCRLGAPGPNGYSKTAPAKRC